MEHPNWQKINQSARKAYVQGNDAQAIAMLCEAVEQAKDYGHEDIHLSDIFGNLATLLYDQCKYQEALPLNERALQLLERFRGSDHLDIAQCLTRIADCHSMQGDEASALPLYRRALAIYEAHYDADHNKVISSRDDVGRALTNLGNDAWARFLSEGTKSKS